MAIQTTSINVTNTTTYVSSGETALTMMSLCNHSGITQTVTLNIVPNGDLPATTNIFIKDIEIVAGDTFVVYQGSEKFILDDNDFVNATCSNANAVTVITSYMVI